jgi:hypothetical protein
MSQNIIKSSELNIADVSFIVNVDKTTKRKIFFVNHLKKPIFIKTPCMYSTGGIKHWKSDAYPDSFELEVSFGEDKDDSLNNDKVQDFYEKMKQLDNLIKTQILENPMEWIGKKKTSMEMIEESYYPKPIVKVAQDKEGNLLEYAPKMKFKVERERNGENFTGKFSSSNRDKTQVMIFDKSGTNLDLDEENCESVVPRGTKGNYLIQLVNINVVGDKVYPKWKLVQGKIRKNTSGIIDRNIMDDDDEDNEIQDDLDSETPEKKVEFHEVIDDQVVVDDLDNLDNLEVPEKDPLEIDSTHVKKSRSKRGIPA